MFNQFTPRLPKKLERVKVNIGFPVVRKDGLSGEGGGGGGGAGGVRSRDYQIFGDG